jgi:Zn-dependent protease with chaperone function
VLWSLALAIVLAWLTLLELVSAMVLRGAVPCEPRAHTAEIIRRAGVPRVRFYVQALDLDLAATSGDVLFRRIVVLNWPSLQLSPLEIDSLVAHELGHLHHNHPLKKKLLLTFGLWRQLRKGAWLYEKFEREADAFAHALMGIDVREEMRERSEIRIGEQPGDVQ